MVLKIVWAFCGQDLYEKLISAPTSVRKRTVPLAETSLPRWPDLVEEAQSKLDLLFSHPADSDIYDDFERPPKPCYDDPIESYDEGRIRLNKTLHEALQEMKDKDNLSSHLAKICQHLLLSRTPPNVHAYNLLLVRFCQLEEISLVHFVLEAMWESHIRPNEITHVTVLRFFTITGNKAEFSLYVKRMRGLRGGLALADPDKPLSPLVKSRVHLFGERLQKVAQKARMNHEVYSALIVGLLRFFDPEDAMYWYRAMIDQGWRPTAELLTAILRECCLKSDWAAGMAVWQQFARETVKMTLSAYEWMLRLCQSCEQHHMYQDILDHGIREGMLPAGILDHTHDFRSKDAKLVIADAKSKHNPGTDQHLVNMVAFPLRREFERLQKSEALEGRVYSIENSLQGATVSRVELNERVQTLIRDRASLLGLQKFVVRRDKAFIKLSDEIALTVSEIVDQMPMIKFPQSVLKIGLSGSLRSIPLDQSPTDLLTLYDEYRQRCANQLEQVSALDSSSTGDAELSRMAL